MAWISRSSGVGVYCCGFACLLPCLARPLAHLLRLHLFILPQSHSVVVPGPGGV